MGPGAIAGEKRVADPVTKSTVEISLSPSDPSLDCVVEIISVTDSVTRKTLHNPPVPDSLATPLQVEELILIERTH
jgi:hypothetical protein